MEEYIWHRTLMNKAELTYGQKAVGLTFPSDGKTSMDFSEALRRLKGGAQVARLGWNGKGLFVEAQFPDEHSKMGNPYLFIDAGALGGKRNPWVPSQTDLFARDWTLVGDQAKVQSPKQ